MMRFALHYFVLYALVATVWPYFPTFLRARGFSQAEIGYLQGFRMLAEAAGPLMVAYLSQRLGRRRTLISGCLVAFGVASFGLNSTSAFLTAAVLMAAAGFALRTTIPLSDTLSATELPDPAHNYGRIRIGGSLGFVAALWCIRLFNCW